MKIPIIYSPAITLLGTERLMVNTMEIHCIECQSANYLRRSRINVNGLMVRCRMCNYIFMVYPPDIYGAPVAQETNIDQSILDDLIDIQDDSGDEMAVYEISGERHDIMSDDQESMKKLAEEDSSSDPDDFEYADLPDLSELEKMIDWGDIDDQNDRPAKPNQKDTDTPDIDVDTA